jgi:hypothetical protein
LAAAPDFRRRPTQATTGLLRGLKHSDVRRHSNTFANRLKINLAGRNYVAWIWTWSVSDFPGFRAQILPPIDEHVKINQGVAISRPQSGDQSPVSKLKTLSALRIDQRASALLQL